ncbi:cutinase family protein [Nocardia sp. CY41]|uniref:cutinase family protein n=1 Tax=Nocardia sp. CY41 TaxID=2608686 RepID=UPI0013571833|nr:cutinase family protein [Nocardia sp. CY41]
MRHVVALTAAAIVCGGTALAEIPAQAEPPSRPTALLDETAPASQAAESRTDVVPRAEVGRIESVSAGLGSDGAVPVARCPGLLVLGVQGTGESTPAANPDITGGMLGTMVGPMLAQGVDIAHVNIPYEASFGGAPGTGPGAAPFAASVDQATARLNATAAEVVSRCPQTMLAVAAYSQGAVAGAEFARQVGAGQGPVPADRVAGVALFSDGTRPAGGAPFPGAPGQMTPSPAPGTDGAATSQVRVPVPPASGGITPNEVGFGALSGRVAEFCAPGDLACDAPGRAAVLRTAAGLAARADLHDPLAAVSSVSAAWHQTTAAATSTVLLNDIQVDGTGVNYVPAASVSDRIADAADPRTPAPGADQAQATADKISRIVAAVAADPLRQLPQLAGQLGAAVQAELAANADLLNPATILSYADPVGNHTSYAGDGATQQAAEWFGALSRDIATARGGR